MVKSNCVQARANQKQPIEILELLQVGHCSNRIVGTEPEEGCNLASGQRRRTGLMPFFFPFGGQAKSNCEVRDHHKIIWSAQFRPDSRF